jgi:hypothetical protein
MDALAEAVADEHATRGDVGPPPAEGGVGQQVSCTGLDWHGNPPV